MMLLLAHGGALSEDSWPTPESAGYAMHRGRGLRAMLSRGDSKPALDTVRQWFAVLRAKVASAMAEEPSSIGGPGIRVQVDEAQLGRRNYHLDRERHETRVLGMITDDGEVRFEVVADRKAKTLVDAVQRHVRAGSIIVTDEWRSYTRLGALGYEHVTVNHSVKFVSPSGDHTQQTESQWRALRRKFTRGEIRPDDIPLYPAEYTWRRLCRLRGESPFESLLRLIRA